MSYGEPFPLYSSQYRKWAGLGNNINSTKGSSKVRPLVLFAKYMKYFLSVFKNSAMELVVPSLMFVVMIIIILFSSTPVLAQQQGSTCNACNCKINNVDILTQLIESIKAEPVGKL